MYDIELIGVLAGFISTVAFLPQALKVYRAKSTAGISLVMYILYCLGLILWGVYAYMIESWPLLITEVITGVMAFYILFMKVKHQKYFSDDKSKPFDEANLDNALKPEL